MQICEFLFVVSYEMRNSFYEIRNNAFVLWILHKS